MIRLPSSSISHQVLSIAATFAVLAAAISSGPSQAQSIKASDLAPFQVIYEVGNNLMSAGSARLILANEGDEWHYSLKTSPRGMFKLAGKGRLSETSTFTVVEQNGLISMQPQTYEYRQDNERRRAVDAQFDWDEKTITHLYRGNEVTDTFTDPVLDRLTVTLLIMNALRNDFDKATLPIFDTGKIKLVEFINDGEETLKTPIGDIETIRVINRNATGGSRETATWFAPSLGYVPIKIEHRKRDELVVRLSLVKLENQVTKIEFGKAMPLDEDDMLDFDNDHPMGELIPDTQ